MQQHQEPFRGREHDLHEPKRLNAVFVSRAPWLGARPGQFAFGDATLRERSIVSCWPEVLDAATLQTGPSAAIAKIAECIAVCHRLMANTARARKQTARNLFQNLPRGHKSLYRNYKASFLWRKERWHRRAHRPTSG